ncbi:hypothetical protein ACHWQZ_G012201 [Mnemiopsis leidyi]
MLKVVILALVGLSQAMHPTHPKLNLVKRAGDHCEDVGDAKDCEWWNEQGYCADDSEFHDAMIEQCAKTCGCGAEEELELEEVIVVKRDCENKGSAEDCAWWKEQGYCAADSEFNGAMMDQCPCTCEEKKVEEVLLVKRDCENKGSAEDCAWWKEQGYCAADSEFNGAMMDQCPCTCEYGQRGRMSELKQLEIVEKRSAEQLARPGKRSAEQLARPGKRSAEQLARPGKRSAEQLARPGKRSAEQLARPGKRSAEQLARPGKRSAEQLARPVKRSAEKLARPRKRSAEQLARPGKRSAEQLARPGKRSAEQLARPGKRSAEQLARPGKRSAEQLARPGKRSAEQLARPGKRSAEQLARPGKRSAEQLARPGKRSAAVTQR